MSEKTYNHFVTFHTGQFLEMSLKRSGFSIEWLAEKANCDVATMEKLFTQPNMDAELFVKIGCPMGAAFFEPLHERIFHYDTSA